MTTACASTICDTGVKWQHETTKAIWLLLRMFRQIPNLVVVLRCTWLSYHRSCRQPSTMPSPVGSGIDPDLLHRLLTALSEISDWCTVLYNCSVLSLLSASVFCHRRLVSGHLKVLLMMLMQNLMVMKWFGLTQGDAQICSNKGSIIHLSWDHQGSIRQ